MHKFKPSHLPILICPVSALNMLNSGYLHSIFVSRLTIFGSFSSQRLEYENIPSTRVTEKPFFSRVNLLSPLHFRSLALA